FVILISSFIDCQRDGTTLIESSNGTDEYCSDSCARNFGFARQSDDRSRCAFGEWRVRPGGGTEWREHGRARSVGIARRRQEPLRRQRRDQSGRERERKNRGRDQRHGRARPGEDRQSAGRARRLEEQKESRSERAP